MGPDLIAIHIMKTAGTSLRRMVIDGVGASAVYPNDADLSRRHKGWYPSPQELLEHVRDGHHHGARVLIGHVPYVLAEELERRPTCLTLLRDPIARSVSMLEHRRTRTRRLRDATLEELLDHEDFVEGQLRDYQTKMFAFDSVSECADHVNGPLAIDDARFERALERLESVEVLGVVERMPLMHRRLETVTGIRIDGEHRANRGRYRREPLDPGVLRRLEELTARDAVLYQHALTLIEARAGRDRLRPSAFVKQRLAPVRRWVTRVGVRAG